MITMQDYQVRAHETAQSPSADPMKMLAALVMGLTGDAGNVANLLQMRLMNIPTDAKTAEDIEALGAIEQKMYNMLGCTLWSIAEICSVMDWNLSELARANLANRRQMAEEAGKGGEKEGKEKGKW